MAITPQPEPDPTCSGARTSGVVAFSLKLGLRALLVFALVKVVAAGLDLIARLEPGRPDNAVAEQQAEAERRQMQAVRDLQQAEAKGAAEPEPVISQIFETPPEESLEERIARIGERAMREKAEGQK